MISNAKVCLKCEMIQQLYTISESLYLQSDVMEKYIQKYLLYALLWSFSGDGKLKIREELGSFIRRSTNISLPAQHNLEMIDFEVGALML